MIYNFTRAIVPPGKPVTDSWYHKTILTVYGNMLPFKVGDKVLIKSDLYNGIHEIGYIYKGFSSANGQYQNLYFKDLDFVGNTAGTIEFGAAEPAPTPVTPVVELKPEQPKQPEPAPQPEQTLNTGTPVVDPKPEANRNTDQVLYTAESQEQPSEQSTTEKIEATAAQVVDKANRIPARWFYFILFVVAVAVFIYYQSKN